MTIHILKQSSHSLLSILSKVNELKNYKTIMAKYLNSDILNHMEIMKFEKNCLFILLDNGHWTTQFRFQIPDLITNLRNHSPFEKLNGIICKTRPHPFSRFLSIKKRKVQRISDLVAKEMVLSAKTIHYPKLRDIILKIAKYTNRGSL